MVTYDLSLILRTLVNEKKWFNTEFLNIRIGNIKLKGQDARNIPCKISRDFKISGEAIEVLYLVRLLPILLYDKVGDEEDKLWQLYLCLKEIVMLLVLPKLHLTQMEYLRVLIQDYLSHRVKAFPEVPLKPKHHYMCHYPNLCYDYGPLCHLSTLRFESKHSYFERVIRSSQNFKNITYTMTTKHEMLQSFCRAGSQFPVDLVMENAIPFDEVMYYTDLVASLKASGIELGKAEVSHKMVYQGTICDPLLCEGKGDFSCQDSFVCL